MISIKTIASGSSGNCYKISDKSTTFLLEAGIRFPLIREAFNFKLSEVQGCLISHEHKDHSKAVKDVMKAGIDCYMSYGTAKAIKLSGHRLKLVKHKKTFRLGTFKIMPFTTQHDCAEPFGYLIQSDCGDKLLFITDSYYCRYKFNGLTHIMIECNYSKAILDENIQSGLVPGAIRNRIVKSHFELENVKSFLGANNLSKVREIHLIHLSSNNSDSDLFKSEIQSLTGKMVYI